MCLWSFKIGTETKIETTDYEHFLYCIASSVINKMFNHTVPNYYIYKNKKLFNIIKGSEFDPLSYYRNEWNSTQKYYLTQIKLSECKKDIQEEFDRIYQIIEGIYNRPSYINEEVIEIYNKIKNVEESNDYDE